MLKTWRNRLKIKNNYRFLSNTRGTLLHSIFDGLTINGNLYWKHGIIDLESKRLNSFLVNNSTRGKDRGQWDGWGLEEASKRPASKLIMGFSVVWEYTSKTTLFCNKFIWICIIMLNPILIFTIYSVIIKLSIYNF